MIDRIRDIIKKIQKNNMMKRIAPYVELSPDTRYGEGFICDLRHPQAGRKYLKIGSHGIIDATFIFEKETGHITVGNHCLINGTVISVNGVEIGDDVIIAWDTLVYDHNSHSVNWEERKEDLRGEYENYLKYGDPCANKNWSVVKNAPIKICNKVWIGTGCKILKGVTVGEGAVVQAGSVVTSDVEPWTVVGGNPARIIRKLKKYEGTDIVV